MPEEQALFPVETSAQLPSSVPKENQANQEYSLLQYKLLLLVVQVTTQSKGQNVITGLLGLIPYERTFYNHFNKENTGFQTPCSFCVKSTSEIPNHVCFTVK